MRLENKVAIITGGASGFGAAGAQAFAREGAKVVIGDLNPDTAAQVIASIEQAGGTASFVQADVTSEDDCRRLADTAVERYGRLDAVWANAGMATPDLSMADTSVDQFRKVMDVNALGPWLTVRAAADHLRASGGGAVVITASLSGVKGRPNLSAYQASKGAAVMLVRSIALELAPEVRVNGVSPVASNTPMMETFLANRDGEREDLLGAVASVLPLQRLARPVDVALAALFLLSNEAAAITGQNLLIDAGATA